MGGSLLERFDFSRGGWDPAEFCPAWSTACKVHRHFLQEDDCLTNSAYADGNFDYASMVTKKTYGAGTRLRTRCSFESFGAPLIVFTNDLREGDDGAVYGLHFEVVAYEGGCNIWRIVPADTARGIATTALAKVRFPVPAQSEIDLEVELKDRAIGVRVNGHSFEIHCGELPERVHVGITACEGINRFYDFSIE